MNQKCDVVIVGTGAAGLYSALTFPEDTNIHMVTKRKVDGSQYIFRIMMIIIYKIIQLWEKDMKINMKQKSQK